MNLYRFFLSTGLFFGIVLFTINVSYAQCSFTNYTLSPNGYICNNSTTVTLSGSQTGVTYQLQGNGVGNIGSSVNGTGSALSWTNVPVTTGGTYLVLASKSGCSATIVANTTIYYTAPPNGTVAQNGAFIWDNNTVTLSVTPAVSGTYTYTWFRNGQYISGGSSSTYTATAAGSYFVLMNSSCGSKQLNFQNIVSLPLIASDCSQLNSAPTAANNYIITDIIRQPGITSSTTDAQIAAIGNCDVTQTIQYIDGLGRPMQTVRVKGSSLESDIVQPIAYDQYGREATKYLPYVAAASNNGAYRSSAISEQAVFYHPSSSTSGSQQSNGIINTASPFALTNYEPSPLNRVIEQGATGDAWQPVAGHTVKIAYSSNAANEVTLWAINSSGIGATGNTSYAAGTLYKTITTDENGNNTIEYKDKQSRVICRIVQNGTANLATYYVYDNLNNLTYVIPPIPSSSNPQITAYPTSFAETDAVFVNYMYGYHYDGRNRVVQKKIPGKGWEFIVYNTLDQVVMTQDANQRNKSPQQWTYTKYDALGRVVINGQWNYSGTSADNSMGSPILTYLNWLQNTYNSTTSPKWETTTNTTTTGYTNVSIPQDATAIYFTINYYDDYTFTGQPSTFTTPSGISTMTRGLLTATKTAVLNTINNATPDMLWKVNYYDGWGRVVQSYAQHYLGGVLSPYNYDVFTNAYDFTNDLTSATRQQYVKNAGNTAATLSVTVANTYIYDHEGRKKQTLEQINGGANVLLADDEYNEIGQLTTKNLHGTTVNNITTYLQSTAYAYNERGWLKSINNPTAVSTTQVYGEQLQYNDGSVPQYNGNISGMLWQTMVPTGMGLTQQQQSYAYTYDGMNRLTLANYTTSGNSGKFNEAINYDVLGNITGLQRTNTTTAGQYLNKLIYDYTSRGAGNQLYGVTDAGTAAQGGIYTYDVNGNVVTDTRNQITNIAYNLLNLPGIVSRTPGNMTYVYDANGTKLEKISGTITMDYIRGIEYNNGSIEFVTTEEGRARPSGGSYVYEYYLKDHLGNTRAAVKQDGSIIQVQDYYAFGLEMNPGNSLMPSPANQYKYSGKEKQQETGEIDFGARYYDGVLGRWNTIDPLSEISRNYSPYNYVEDDPIRNTDPDGMACAGCQFHSDPDTWRLRDTPIGNNGNSDTKPEPVVQNANGKGPKDNILLPVDPKSHLPNVTLDDVVISSTKTPTMFQGPDNGSFKNNPYMSSSQDLDNAAKSEAMFLGSFLGGEFIGAALEGASLFGDAGEDGLNSVYQGFDQESKLRYVGITERNIAERFAEHSNSFGTGKELLDYEALDGATGLSRIEARTIEQQLINKYGLGGRVGQTGQLLNKINSIAPKYWEQLSIQP